MKNYFLAILTTGVLITSVTVIPRLISAKDDALVLIGVLAIIVAIPIIYILIKHVYEKS